MSNIAAWATFDGYSGQIISSCNIGSVTHVGPGQYKLCFATPRSSVDYGVMASAQTDITSSNPITTGIGAGDQDTILLLKCDGPNGSTVFTDSSNYSRTVSVNGNTHIDGTVSKFGGGSATFDGSGDSLTLAADSVFAFTGDFTIDCWLRVTTAPAIDSSFIFEHGTSYFVININGSHSFDVHLNNSTPAISGGSYSIGQWHYVALCRSGSAVRLFIDGQLAGSASYTGTLGYSTAPFAIGGNPEDGNSMVGCIDEFRIIRDKALYTADFTPSISPGNVLGPMSRDCFYVTTSSGGTPTDAPLVTASVIAGCDSGSSGSCQCC